MTQYPQASPPQGAPLIAVNACGQTEVGPTRARNQDAIVVAGAIGVATGTRLSWSGEVPGAGLAVAVVDGMGGHAGGGEAAVIAAGALAAIGGEPQGQGWDAWFGALSQRIAHAGAAWGTAEMGATVALLALTPAGLAMANVGDCRIYRVVGGRLGQISVDDRTGVRNSNAVTQALGGFARIDAHTWVQPYRGGPERYMLCSDGVWEALDTATLRDLCGAGHPPGDVVDAVVAAVYARDAADNCSIVVVDLIAGSTGAAAEPGVRVGRRADIRAERMGEP
jgi:serine/threonine protein phosphatase PrpC